MSRAVLFRCRPSCVTVQLWHRLPSLRFLNCFQSALLWSDGENSDSTYYILQPPCFFPRKKDGKIPTFSRQLLGSRKLIPIWQWRAYAFYCLCVQPLPSTVDEPFAPHRRRVQNNQVRRDKSISAVTEWCQPLTQYLAEGRLWPIWEILPRFQHYHVIASHAYFCSSAIHAHNASCQNPKRKAIELHIKYAEVVLSAAQLNQREDELTLNELLTIQTDNKRIGSVMKKLSRLWALTQIKQLSSAIVPAFPTCVHYLIVSLMRS